MYWCVRVWSGFSWLRIGYSGTILWTYWILVLKGEKAEYFSTGWTTVSFPRTIQFYWVSKYKWSQPTLKRLYVFPDALFCIFTIIRLYGYVEQVLFIGSVTFVCSKWPLQIPLTAIGKCPIWPSLRNVRNPLRTSLHQDRWWHNTLNTWIGCKKCSYTRRPNETCIHCERCAFWNRN
jgi:hypothetical protein